MNKKIETLLDIVSKISKEQIKNDNELYVKNCWNYAAYYDNVMEFYRMVGKTKAAPLFIFKCHDNTGNYHVIFADVIANDMKAAILSKSEIMSAFGIDVDDTESDIIASKNDNITRDMVAIIAGELASHIKLIKAGCLNEDTLESVITNILMPLTDEPDMDSQINLTSKMVDYTALTSDSEDLSNSDESDDLDCDEDDEF